MITLRTLRSISRKHVVGIPTGWVCFPVLLGLLLVGACSRQGSSQRMVGGGDHRIHGIALRPLGRGLGKTSGTVKLVVGDELKLQVMASWGIPSVTDVTQEAFLVVDPETAGILTRDGVFRATSPGLAHIRAVLWVESGRGGDEIKLTDTLAVTIVAK